ncbi:hypothetical protein AAW14_21685 [Streptomyces hygroscopicus]|nr:hypothetical protein [Streptomyces hygroscopicus]
MIGLDRARRRAVVGCKSSCGSPYVQSDVVCAGHSSGGMDTCQGDSGGPPLTGGVLAGITS